MKEKFEKAVIEVIKFDDEDVITTSAEPEGIYNFNPFEDNIME